MKTINVNAAQIPDGQGGWIPIPALTHPIDATLTQAGYAADAKAVGDALGEQSDKIDAKLDAPETAGQAGQVLGLDSDLNKVWMTAGGVGVEYGAGLKLTGNVLSVDTANVVQQDNTKPVTSAAVYTEVGNINALLATI